MLPLDASQRWGMEKASLHLRPCGTGGLWYTVGMTTDTLKLAMEKAAALPAATQEEIGRDILDYVDGMARLRAELEVGIKQLDAGLGTPLDIEAEIERARREYEA
jgi:hypothetical protein